MKSNWVVPLVVSGAIACAGAFVFGMARVSGLTSGATGASARPPTRADAASSTVVAAPAAAAVAVESAPMLEAPAASDGSEQAPAPTGDAVADDAVGDDALAGDAVAVVEAPSPDAVAADAATGDAASADPVAVDAIDVSPVTAPAAVATGPLAGEARRRAQQCRALGEWLQQLASLAAERRDAGYVAWTRAQQALARERQTELSCPATG